MRWSVFDITEHENSGFERRSLRRDVERCQKQSASAMLQDRLIGRVRVLLEFVREGGAVVKHRCSVQWNHFPRLAACREKHGQ